MICSWAIVTGGSRGGASETNVLPSKRLKCMLICRFLRIERKRSNFHYRTAFRIALQRTRKRNPRSSKIYTNVLGRRYAQPPVPYAAFLDPSEAMLVVQWAMLVDWLSTFDGRCWLVVNICRWSLMGRPWTRFPTRRRTAETPIRTGSGREKLGTARQKSSEMPTHSAVNYGAQEGPNLD